MTNRVKKLIQLMLIVMMVGQPVALSYAMAGMDHSQHMGVMENHVGEHAAHDMGGMSAKQLNDATQDDDMSAMNDCCNSAACCPATVVEISVLLHQPIRLHSFFTHLSWEAIALPTEVKPPRPLFI